MPIVFKKKHFVHRTLHLVLCFFLFVNVGCKKKLPEYVEISYDQLVGEIDFNIDVKPILSDKCFLCHGPDAGTRKADLRFDIEGCPLGMYGSRRVCRTAFRRGQSTIALHFTKEVVQICWESNRTALLAMNPIICK